MRDLITPRSIGSARIPAGIAFEIMDLILIGCWAAVHDVEMLIRLDHGVEDADYEEVVEFRARASSNCRWLMWRDAEVVFVQPMIGKRTEHKSVVVALDSLRRNQRRRRA